MELDDLKKSWNALDEHLKNKEFIEEKEIAQLLGRARNKMNSIDRFNRKLRFASIGILTLAVLFWICADTLTDLFYWIALSLCIPALCWDLYSAHYLSRTRIDEMPLVTVISRINRYHRWMVREWIIGILYLLAMATFFLFHRQVWQYGAAGIIVSLIVWAIGLGICLWVYRRNIRHIKEIKKNLNELKELNHTA
ncbi:hypothetical protein NXX78_20365 [Bacteroides fragilis]|nr:hypothetical protein [Bacteroides fragilis]